MLYVDINACAVALVVYINICWSFFVTSQKVEIATKS